MSKLSKIFAFVSALMISSSAFGAMAVIYNCVGENTAGEYPSSVMFTITYADSAPEYGYTRQEIEIVRDGWSAPETSIVYSLNGAENCKVNSEGTIDAAKANIEWLDSADKDVSTKVSVEIGCEQFKLKTIAYCASN